MKSIRAHIAKHVFSYFALVATATIVVVALARGWFSSANAPAWVQAYGSIAAILSAVWIASQQAARQQRAERDRALQRLKMAKELSGQLLDALDAARADVADGKAEFSPDNFDTVAEALREVAISDLPTGKAAIAIVNQRRNLQFYRQAFEAFQRAQGHIIKANGEIAEFRALGGMDETVHGLRQKIEQLDDLKPGLLEAMEKHIKGAIVADAALESELTAYQVS